LTLDAVARGVGMSPFHFCRVFRALVGLPPHRYLRRVRLERAAARLRAGAGVTDTCHATGFNNLGHFVRAFREAYGVPPGRFRG
ncbi:MAG TPA: helix-turn-helix transcriptional regulator, partial [Dongiaceae bacterium]|nr:helix-turn-helix transcriptional regulator [Dongiaceae bacterium]